MLSLIVCVIDDRILDGEQFVVIKSASVIKIGALDNLQYYQEHLDQGKYSIWVLFL